jgi:curved DNA-binding protein
MYDRLGSRWKEGDSAPPPEWQDATAGANGGNDGARQEHHFGGAGFSDFYSQYFGGGGRSRGFEEMFRGARGAPDAGERPDFSIPGSDIEGDMAVTLDEVKNGSTRTISLQRANPATGQPETDTIKVQIPIGVHDGQAIRVRGKGGPGIGGGPPGDLYLRVRFSAHPDFNARGADLYYDLEVAPWEGVLGVTAPVPALGGGQINVRIPPGSDNGRSFRVRGQGLPKGKSGERGDLYVVVNVRLPSQVTAEERDLWEKLQRASRFNPREES